jgi:hypothetical protein
VFGTEHDVARTRYEFVQKKKCVQVGTRRTRRRNTGKLAVFLVVLAEG